MEEGFQSMGQHKQVWNNANRFGKEEKKKKAAS